MEEVVLKPSLWDLKWEVAAALSASLSFLMVGAVRGYSSPAVPSMMRDDTFEIDSTALSLITSLPAVGALIAALFSGIFLKYFGRRRTLMLTSLPWTASFLMVAFCRGLPMLLYSGRVIMGTMIGLSLPASQIYIAECSSASMRGAFSSLTALSLAGGILLAYVIGAFVEWNTLAWILSIFPALLMASMAIMPESPTWLLSNGRQDEAEAALRKLRGAKADIQAEITRIRNSIQQSAPENSMDVGEVEELISKKKKTKMGLNLNLKPKVNPALWKPVAVSLSLMVLQQFSGINVVIFNTVLIFKMAGVNFDPSLATIVVGIIQFVATILSAVLVDKAGRRILLLVSGIGMAASMSAIGTAFYYAETQADLQGEPFESSTWLPLISIGVFVISYSVGYSNVPYVVMGEIFPLKYRNMFSAIASSVNLSSVFIVLFTFPKLQAMVGGYGTFWIYCCCNVIGVAGVFFFLPETKGKTLEDIERLFIRDNGSNTSKTLPSDWQPSLPNGSQNATLTQVRSK